MREVILNPPHYNEMNLPFMKGAGLLRGFCLGNAIKYIDRAGKKSGSTESQDLLKAIEYITLYLEYRQYTAGEVKDRGNISERLSNVLTEKKPSTGAAPYSSKAETVEETMKRLSRKHKDTL